MSYRDGTTLYVVVVLDLVGLLAARIYAQVFGRVASLRRDALPDRLRQDERLKRTARLPLTLRSEVKLHLLEVRATHHRPNCTRGRFHRDQGRRRIAR